MPRDESVGAGESGMRQGNNAICGAWSQTLALGQLPRRLQLGRAGRVCLGYRSRRLQKSHSEAGLRMICILIQIAIGIWDSAFYRVSTGCHCFPKRRLLIHDCDDGLLKAEIKVIISVTYDRNVCKVMILKRNRWVENVGICHNYDYYLIFLKWAFCNIPSGRMEVCMFFCMYVITVSLTRWLKFSDFQSKSVNMLFII